MQDWLDNMGDWNISRKRYWGLPLMFFECKCGHTEIIGSLKELREKAVDKKTVDSLQELHRPWIDKIKIKCGKCGEAVERIKEVGDCWLDAGIVPFSTLKYLEDKRFWKKWYPARLIIEMRAQVRLWFYSMLFMSVTLENNSPYDNVFAYETVGDEKGEEMHKSKGNAIWFDDAVEKMGADVMRWMYCSQNPKIPLRFGYGPAKEATRDLTVIWNLGNYVNLYCKNAPKTAKNLSIEDKWIISKTESLKKKVTGHLEAFQPNMAIKEASEFLLNSLSRDYGQFIRNRLNDKTAQYVLNKCYLEGLKVLAPFLPFIAEKLYLDNYKQKESLFLEDWPKCNEKLIDTNLEKAFAAMEQVVQAALSAREKAQLGVRWPLAEMVVVTKDKAAIAAVKKLSGIIKQQLNVKKITLKTQFKKTKGFEEADISSGKVYLDTKQTPELEAEGFARELMRKVQSLRRDAGLKKIDEIELVVVTSNNAISKYKAQIKEKVGAKTLEITSKEPKKPFSKKSEEKIKGKQFSIYFNICN